MPVLPTKRTDNGMGAYAFNRQVEIARAQQMAQAPGILVEKGVNATFVRTQTPPPAKRFRIGAYRFKSMGDDYIVCRTWDGTTEGGTDIYIAKPQELWCSVVTEVIDGVTVTYSDWDLDSQTRTADNGTTTETQAITPRYRADGDDPTFIWACVGPTFLDDPTSDLDTPPQLKLGDMNRGGRAWAKVGS